MEQLLTIDQLATMLQVPKSWIYERTRMKNIPHRRIGKYLRFDVNEIETWVKLNCKLPINKFVKYGS